MTTLVPKQDVSSKRAGRHWESGHWTIIWWSRMASERSATARICVTGRALEIARNSAVGIPPLNIEKRVLCNSSGRIVCPLLVLDWAVCANRLDSTGMRAASYNISLAGTALGDVKARQSPPSARRLPAPTARPLSAAAPQ